jgi:hypothetical protein
MTPNATPSAGASLPASDHRSWSFTAVQCGNFVGYMDGFSVEPAGCAR